MEVLIVNCFLLFMLMQISKYANHSIKYCSTQLIDDSNS